MGNISTKSLNISKRLSRNIGGKREWDLKEI